MHLFSFVNFIQWSLKLFLRHTFDHFSIFLLVFYFYHVEYYFDIFHLIIFISNSLSYMSLSLLLYKYILFTIMK